MHRLGIDETHHIYRIDVVTPNHRTTGPGRPRKTLFPEGKLPVAKIYANVGIQQLKPIHRHDWTRWYFRYKPYVSSGNGIDDGTGRCRNRRRVLVFRANE